MSEAKDKIILALDKENIKELEKVLDPLKGELKWVKVGLQLFTKYGPGVVDLFANKGFSIFLDLKLHDIPNTVASAVKSLRDLPIGMLTIHASGGSEMIQSAVQAAEETNPKLLILGVTVLTSMNQEALNEVGVLKSPLEQVSSLAKMGSQSGLKGLVCSPLEVEPLRKKMGDGPVLVTPGIRPTGSEVQDQKRIMTPAKAVEAGSSYMVIGRPILQAADPLAAFHAIVNEIDA